MTSIPIAASGSPLIGDAASGGSPDALAERATAFRAPLEPGGRDDDEAREEQAL